MRSLLRLPFLFLAMLSLLVGLWAGLNRIGWTMYALPSIVHHGAIMAGGFLGTLISLEKIIPLKKKMLYSIPLLSGVSVVFFLLQKDVVAYAMLVTASAALCLVFAYYLVTQRDFTYLLMFAGSIGWLTGNIVLASQRFYPAAFPWWAAFVLFIISAERLELMKFLPVNKKQKIIFSVWLFLFPLGIILSFHSYGNILCAVALMGIAVWLLRFDLIAITLKKEGLPQYVAVALTGGYVALLLSGLFLITFVSKTMGYDAVVHTFFIGFVFSMIFAHGPIILPGVLGIVAKPFHRILYLWLFLLHASWLLRCIADACLYFEWRRATGCVTAVSIAGYFISMAILTARSDQHAKTV
jgi:hypothetical protein